MFTVDNKSQQLLYNVEKKQITSICLFLIILYELVFWYLQLMLHSKHL